MLFLGLDPGYSGGLAIIEDGDVTLRPWPGDEDGTWALVNYWGKLAGKCGAVIEEVHSMPHDGVHSAFKFGRHYGTLRGMLVAAGTPFVAVIPQKWQAEYQIVRDKANDESQYRYKARLRKLAESLFPNAPVAKETADALLLAEYCKRHHKQLFPTKS